MALHRVGSDPIPVGWHRCAAVDRRREQNRFSSEVEMPRIPADVRREQFIAAATTVIAECGIEGATTRRIAEAAGAPLASLHYCFRSKEELLWALWEAQAKEIWTTPTVRRPGTTGLADAATLQLLSAMRWWMDSPEKAITNFELSLWARRQDRALGARAYNLYLESSKKLLRDHLEPDDDLSLVEPLASMVAAAVDGLLLHHLTSEDPNRTARDLAMWCESIEALVDARRGQTNGRKKKAVRTK
jgi:AcrR family transcriptional regulator